MDPILEVRDLKKTYPSGVQAVRGISFKIEPGICFGLLGPNGAGKSTTIEMMEGVLPISSGQIFYRGKPVGDEFRQNSGIQFQNTALQDYLKVGEVLDLFARMYKKTMDIQKLIDLCSLREFLDRDSQKLSGGQRQRLLLAVALVNDPDVLFLDEPTTGLDPQARRNFWDLIQNIKANKKTIVLTTHYMEEAYTLCDRIAIVDQGKLIAEGTPDHLLKTHFDTVTIEMPDADLRPHLEKLKQTGMQEAPVSLQGYFRIHTRNVNQTLGQLLNVGADLSRLKVRGQTLEDLFIELTGKELRE